MDPLLEFLRRLEAARIHFRLGRIRDESILVDVAVPGERWEVEFMEGGEIEIERFRSDGHIAHGAEALEELFARYTDPPLEAAV